MEHSANEHLGLVPSEQGGVEKSPSKTEIKLTREIFKSYSKMTFDPPGVEPSQQISSDLEHLDLPPLPPPRTLAGILPSAHVAGLPPSGHGGVVLFSVHDY